LTNGIEIMPDGDCSFIRIRSTDCERKRYRRILEDVDHNLLMHLALGHHCIVYDCGCISKESRAVYWGFRWIRYAVEMVWFGHSNMLPGPKKLWDRYLARIEAGPDDSLMVKLRYYRRFLKTDKLNLEFKCKKARRDGEKKWYKEALHGHDTR